MDSINDDCGAGIVDVEEEVLWYFNGSTLITYISDDDNESASFPYTCSSDVFYIFYDDFSFTISGNNLTIITPYNGPDDCNISYYLTCSGSCGGDTVCDDGTDEDEDGIDDCVDTCVGFFDECGICDGDNACTDPC